MKFAFATILIFSLLGVAVLGFLAMNHGEGHSGCIAAAANGLDCVQETRSFSLAVLFGLALFALVLLFSFGFKAPSPALYLKWRNFQILFLPQKSLLIRWLALHENSPSFS